MAYSVINKTGCCERKGHPQIRFDMFLEPDDRRYEETYVQVPVIPAGGYPNKTDKDGNPVDQKDYDLWYASLPRIWQLNPFHSHFIGYYPHDFTDSQLKSDMDFHLANFYKAYQDGWDSVKGGMRHGFAVEKRIIPINYAKTLEVVEYKAIQTQVINRLNRLDEFKHTPIKLDDGKVYPATTIDVGSGAVDGNVYDSLSFTNIDATNPANGTGSLDTVETWLYSNATGFKAGTFYGSDTSYTSRDYETIGAVTGGAKRTFTGLSIDVVTGDFIGGYAATGYIERTNSGGTGVYLVAGDQFGTGSAVYNFLNKYKVSLYATGETLQSAPTITNSTGESNVTATAARLNGELTDDGGLTTSVTVYWGDNDGGSTPSNWDNNYSLGNQSIGTFYHDVSSLSSGTTYYYRYYAENSEGGDWADSTASFLTKPAAPTNVSATDGTHTDKVVITWSKSTGATGYKIYEGSNLLDTVGDVATYDDTAAPAPTITAGSAVASDGTSSEYVSLSLSGTSVSNGSSRTYKVVAFNAAGDSADSSTDTGYRGVGSLTYQWQRSAADSDASYSNISGATSSTYNDTDGAVDPNGRYYRCVLNATGATQQISAADRGYRKLDTTIELSGFSDTSTRVDAELYSYIMLSGESYSYTRTDVGLVGAPAIKGKSSTDTRMDASLYSHISVSGYSQTTTRMDVIISVVPLIYLRGKSYTSTRMDVTLIPLSFPPPATKYAIELRTAAGALKQIFEAAYGVSHTQVVNEPHTLAFNLRGTDPKRSDIRWPYEFWLRNMVTGSVVKKFILTGESDSDSRNNLTTQINASSLLAQLGMETLQSDLTITDTVENICIELLTHQRLTPAITLGTIEITTEVSMSWTGHPTLLACINNLLDAVGGYLDVNDDRELDWLDDVGEDKGQQIRQGKNIVALKQDIDWMSFATVLYPVGNSIKLSDKTMTMEVATKSADATYGYLTVPTDYVCFDEDTLLILRQGTVVDYIGSFASGVEWLDAAKVLDIDWTTYAYRDFGVGAYQFPNINVLFSEKTISGLTVRLQIVFAGTINFIRFYVDDVLKYTHLTAITPNDGSVEIPVDLGEAILASKISVQINVGSTGIGTINVFSFWAWSEYFDESEDWTNINDRQLSIPIASYHADDTYYLTYTLADYLKDLAAIATWSDEDGNGGEVSRSQTFNYADDVDTLLQWGQVYLPTVSYPPTTYHLEAALLNEVHANFSFDELQKGSIVAVVHDDLGITVNARVLRINQPDLFNSPAEADIDISSQPKTLADAFRALWDRI